MKHLIILAPVLCFSCLFFFVPNAAHAATLYYNDNDGDEQWANLDNWWQDAGFTIPAVALPGPNDDVFVRAEVDNNADDPASVHSADFSNGAIWDGEGNGLILNVSNGATFHDTSYMRGSLNGNVTFNDTSHNNYGSISGNVIFNNRSYNNGTISGNAIFNDASDQGSSGGVTGTITNNQNLIIPTGQFPLQPDVVVGPILYVASQSSITVINSTIDTIIATISVGHSSISGMSVIGTNIYVNNQGTTTVSVIDANPSSGTYNTVIATVPTVPTLFSNVGGNILIGNNIYTLNPVGGSGSSTVSVTDVNPSSPTYNTVIRTITVGKLSSYMSVVGTNLYVDNESSNSISVIDANPFSGTYNTVTATIPGIAQAYSSVVVGTRLYVGDYDSHTVSVIDANPSSGTYNTVIATTSVGLIPEYMSAVGNKVYVMNNQSNTVSVIDANPSSGTYNTVIATVPVGAASGPTYSSVVGTKVYVHVGLSIAVIDSTINTNNVVNVLAPHLLSFTSSSTDGTYITGQSISIKANFNKPLSSTSTMTVVLNSGASVTLNTVSGSTLSGTYVVGSGDFSPDLSVSSISSAFVGDTRTPIDTNTHYVVPISPELTGDQNGNVGDISNISINHNPLAVSVGVNPYQMATVGTLIYVANQGSNTVSVIDTSNNVATATISVGSQPYGVAYATSTQEIYVTNLKGNTVSVIDANPSSGTYNTVTHTISVGVQPYYITASGSYVYCTNHISDTVSVINTGIHAVIATTIVGIGPLALKVLGSNLYVANFGSTYGAAQGTVSVIDTSSSTFPVKKTIVVGSGARGVTVSGNEVYVSNFNDGTVSVINGTTNLVTNTITVGTEPRGMLALGSNVYAENYEDGTISVIATSTHSVTATIKVGNTPAGMTALGTNIYLSRFTDGKVSILNTLNESLILSAFFPTLATPTASSISMTNATFNTSMTSDGDASSTVEGFKYGTTTAYGFVASSTGTYGIGTFTQSISGLSCGTTYHFQAFAVNTAGTGTSTDQTFTTAGCTVATPPTPPVVYASGGGGSVSSTNLASLLAPGAATTAYLNSINTTTATTPTTATGATTPAPIITAQTFSRNLEVGNAGTDVKTLQKFLNSQGYIIAKTGAGSPGHETTTFGTLTKLALAKFQKAHNLPATGYFGPLTRALIKGL